MILESFAGIGYFLMDAMGEAAFLGKFHCDVTAHLTNLEV